MSKLLRSFTRLLLSISLIITLSACSASSSAGLEPFKSTDGRYGFLYPTGWTRVAVSDGPAVVFHDLINSDETLSLVISKLNSEIDLENLGTPEEVGDRLINQLMSPEDNDRKVDLLTSNERESSGHIFYDLEYVINYPQETRHELATVVIDRGNLYTFATGTSEKRWPRVKGMFTKVIDSFTLLI